MLERCDAHEFDRMLTTWSMQARFRCQRRGTLLLYLIDDIVILMVERDPYDHEHALLYRLRDMAPVGERMKAVNALMGREPRKLPPSLPQRLHGHP